MEFDRSNVKKMVAIICGVILFTYILFHFSQAVQALKWVLALLMPFMIGFGVAFIVNVPMKAFENVLFKNQAGRFYRFKRPVCLILSFVCIIAVLTFVITMLIPDMTDTMNSISEKFPGFMDRIKNRAAHLEDDYPRIAEKIKEIDIDWNNVTGSVLDMIKNGGTSIVTSTFSFATSIVSALINLLVGLFFAIYILMQKETLERQTKGLLYATVKEKAADKIIQVCAMADQTFSNFVSGQCLEACILGLMFFVSMQILQIPYALTISITIAITALVPIFGSFAGWGIGTFLILVDNPKKALIFLILFIVLQQIEGNLIYPHVVGGSVGLPSIWVLVAVIVGGDLMGIIGMLIFVPLFSVIYALVKEFVILRLREKKVPWEKYGKSYNIQEGSFGNGTRKKQIERQQKKQMKKRETVNKQTQK